MIYVLMYVTIFYETEYVKKTTKNKNKNKKLFEMPSGSFTRCCHPKRYTANTSGSKYIGRNSISYKTLYYIITINHRCHIAWLCCFPVSLYFLFFTLFFFYKKEKSIFFLSFSLIFFIFTTHTHLYISLILILIVFFLCVCSSACPCYVLFLGWIYCRKLNFFFDQLQRI